MKYYDYKKAKQLINESKDCLESASLGMHEDWFWTAETIFENNEYKKELPDNANEIHDEYVAKIKDGMSILSDEAKQYSDILIGGIYGSEWATPTLQLVYTDGEDKMIPCYYGNGIEISLGDKIEKQIFLTSGCLSSQMQENITPLSNDL